MEWGAREWRRLDLREMRDTVSVGLMMAVNPLGECALFEWASERRDGGLRAALLFVK